MTKDCEKCDGDGYTEKYNDDQSNVVTVLCGECNGSGQANPYKNFYDGTEYEGFYE
jgi:DnaJ-class molecular chaperone